MICENCGCDRTILAECCKSDVEENRAIAEIITGNCPDCKESMEAKDGN